MISDKLMQVLLSEPFDARNVFNIILEEASRLIGAKWADLQVVQGNWLIVRASTNIETLGLWVPIEGSFCGKYIVKDKLPYKYTGDLSTEEQYLNVLDHGTVMKSELAIAVRSQNNLIGILNFESPNYNAFDESHVNQISSYLTSATSFILRVANSLQTDQIHFAANRIIAKLSEEPFSARDIYQVILNEALRLCNAERGQLLLVHPKNLTIHATTGTEPIGTVVSLESICGEFIVMRKQTEVIVDDVEDPNSEYGRFYRRMLGEDVRSEVAVAVMSGSHKAAQLVGIINLESTIPRNFTQLDVDILRSLSDYVSVALQKANDYEVQQMLQEFVNDLVASDMPIVDWLKKILQFSLDLVKASSGQIFIVIGEGLLAEATVHTDWIHEGELIPISRSVNGLSIDNREPILINDLEDYRQQDGRFVGTLNSMSELTVPLFYGDIPIGTINVESERKDAFSYRHAEMIKELASVTNLGYHLKRIEDNHKRIFHGLKGRLSLIRDYISYIEKDLQEGKTPRPKDIERSKKLAQELLDTSTSVVERANLLPLSLNQYISDYMKAFPWTDIHHELTLIHDDLDIVIADENFLKSVLDIVIENAVEATQLTSRSDKEIKIRLEKDDDEIHIFVKDNGTGIPLDEVARIFDNGFTTKKHLKQVAGGSGLGLAEARNLMHKMFGKIAVLDTGIDGTTFRISLGSTACVAFYCRGKISSGAEQTTLTLSFCSPSLDLLSLFNQFPDTSDLRKGLISTSYEFSREEFNDFVTYPSIALIDFSNNPTSGFDFIRHIQLNCAKLDYVPNIEVFMYRSLPETTNKIYALIDSVKGNIYHGKLNCASNNSA